MKSKLLLIAIICCSLTVHAQQNVGIGTTMPDSCAVLDISSNSKGLLLPRLTYTQRVNIQKPTNGLIVYQTDSVKGVYIFLNKWVTPMLQTDPKTNIKVDTIKFTGAIQTFTVPAGVTKMNITIAGAQGGRGMIRKIYRPCSGPNITEDTYYNASPGAVYQGIIKVNPGQNLYINSGGKGTDGNSTQSIGQVFNGGYNGGENSTLTTCSYSFICSSNFGLNTYASEDYYQAFGSGGGATYITLNNTTPLNYLVQASGGSGGFFPKCSYTAAAGGGINYTAPSITNLTLTGTNAGDGYVVISYSDTVGNNIFTGGSSNFSGSIPTANGSTTGLLASTDFSNFFNKISGNGTAGKIPFYTASNAIGENNLFSWDNTNNRLGVGVAIPTQAIDVNGNVKASALIGTGTNLLAVNSEGLLTRTAINGLSGGDNLGSHIASQNISLNNNYLSNNGSNNGLLFNNDGYAALGASINTASKLTINSNNNGTGVSNWIALSTGGTAGNRVVSGTLEGEATIGAHTSSLTNWARLVLNPGGVVNVPTLTSSQIRFVLAEPNGNLSIAAQTPTAATNASGILTATDWNIFNSKQNTLSNASATVSGILTNTDWNTFNGKQNALGNASATVSGILTNVDWNNFYNKQNALANANASNNGILTAVDWNTFNNKQSSSSYASAVQNGVLAASDWNLFNNKFSLPTLINGSILFSNGSTIAQNNSKYFWDNTNSRLGIGTNNPNNSLTVNSTNTGGTNDASDWVASNIGGSAGDRVVSGVLFGKATIGGHTNNINGWADLVINNTNAPGATVTIGSDANVDPASGTDAAALNTKLIVNGHVRQGYYAKAVSISAGTQITITWTHNLGYGPIVMMSTDQNGGGANMVDVTYTTYNNDANQTVFVLKNNGSATATGAFRWIVVH